MKKVIAIVGTSLFTNFIEEDGGNASSIYDKYSDLEDKLHKDWNDYKEDIESIRNSIVNEKWHLTNNASAEITSILEIKKEIKDNLEVYLLSTDTILSRLSAEIIKERFNNSKEGISINFDSSVDVISGLQVKDKNVFETEGLENLFNRLDKIINDNSEKYKPENYENVILNITGGYKGIIPYKTIFGEVNDIPIYYIFEESNHLIKIPELPMDFDFTIIEDNYIAFEGIKPGRAESNLPNIDEFKKDLNKNDSKANEEFVKLRNKHKLIYESNGKIKLTVIGKWLFNKYEYLFNNNLLHRQNLLSKIVELKLLEYYVDKYINQNALEKNKIKEIKQGKKVGNEGFDIDIYIEDDDSIRAIEVKPGMNVPLFSEGENDKKNTIERKLKSGGFKYLIDNNNNKKIFLDVILYSHKEIHPKTIDQIERLHSKYINETKNLKWYHLKLDENYKKDTYWKVDRRLEPLFPKP